MVRLRDSDSSAYNTMKYLLLLLALLIIPSFALAQATSTGFVPLTNIPLLTETGNPFSLESFLNGLYRIAIGAAAVIAVLQIMRAGIMYMGGDSVTEKKEAKNLIGLAIGGLILVLSPVIVFSIINPEILSLKIGNIEDLKVELTPSPPIVLPSTEQGVCSITYVELARSMDCSAAGPEWEMASISCCNHIPAGGFCCGRKPQAPPPPDTGPGFRYRIAVQQTDVMNPDIVSRNQQCVRYETDIKPTQVECVGALDGKKIELQGKEYEVVKECTGNDRSPHRYSNLPTCK